MSGFADRGKPRQSGRCRQCNEPGTVVVLIQARAGVGPTLAGRSSTFCETHALEVFESAEAVLDAAITKEPA